MDDNPDGARALKANAVSEAVRQWVAREPSMASRTQSLFDWGMDDWQLSGARPGSPLDRVPVVTLGQDGQAWNADTESYVARVIDWSPLAEGDVALLKSELKNMPTLQIRMDEVRIGEEVVAVGYPGSADRVSDQSYTPLFKHGQISGTRTIGGGSATTYVMSAPLSRGMSGGPAVDHDGRVVGINSFLPSYEEESFGFVSASSLILEKMRRNGLANEPGQLDVLYREGIDALAAGGYNRAIDRFQQVLALVPGHPVAGDLLSRTMEAKANAPSGTPASMLGAAGALVALTATGTGVALRRRRKLTQATADSEYPTAEAPATQPEPEGVAA